MSNIYINTEQQSIPPTDNQIEGCHGHYVSINAGGKGHRVGDSCGCDGLNPETNIDFIATLLMLSALIIIIRKKIKYKNFPLEFVSGIIKWKNIGLKKQ